MPETENPVPLTVAALTVTGAVPVEVRVIDWVAGEFRLTLPKAMLVALMERVGVVALSCRANVSVAPPVLALRATEVAVLTDETVAEKEALDAPAVMVTVEGTATAELLLAKSTVMALAAAVFNVTVQESEPAAVIELLAQVRPVSTGMPVPLRLTVVDAPVEELLVKVSVPVDAPATVGPNSKVRVAV